MSATIIDGKAFAGTVREKVAGHVSRLKEEHGITPGLAVVLVGEDPASQVYVRSKGKMTVPYFERGPAWHRAKEHGAVHAVGLPYDAARPSRLFERDGCCCDRTLQYCGQAYGTAFAGRQLHCDDSAFAHEGSGRCGAPRGYRCGGSRAV